MLSFCMDLYSSYILHELKVTGHLPCNYFVWIAQMKRKGIARQTCLKAKEMADILYTQCGDKMDPEVSAFSFFDIASCNTDSNCFARILRSSSTGSKTV